jgi:hypothetical protein
MGQVFAIASWDKLRDGPKSPQPVASQKTSKNACDETSVARKPVKEKKL